MRTLLQRVSEACVRVDGRICGQIGKGLLVLVGIQADDTDEDMAYLSNKITHLRIFNDENGVMNRSVSDIKGELLVVSQFTLQANTAKGNRPSYIKAAPGPVSQPLYERFCEALSEAMGKPVETGVFGADMDVMLHNDGPVTIWIDSKDKNY